MCPIFNVTISSTGIAKLADAFQEAGPGGWRIDLTETGTMSCVLAQNLLAPGTTPTSSNLTSVAYYNSSGVAVAAGTAITASGYVTVDAVNADLWVVATITGGASSAYITRQVSPEVGAEPAEGNLPANNPTFTGTLTGPLIVGTDTTDSSSSTTGALKTAGGLGVAKALYVGTSMHAEELALTGTPASHAINLEGTTLAANTNAIRGASVNPTRTSGWTAFTGTISTTPNPCYMDYRELHSTGAAEILGAGFFPFMDSGATGKSMFAIQAIAEADSGATVGAATAVGDGVFPIWAKCLINGAGFNASGVAAAAWLSFQANVTDVSALDTSMINMEVASGGINAIFKFQCSAAAGATYFVNFENNALPAEKTSASTTATNNVVGNIKVLVGDQVGYINIHSAKAT